MMELKQLEEKLGLNFKNVLLLQQALVHRSYLNESEEFSQSNERLEFLGDSVLQLLTSHNIYNKFPKYTEGELTNLRSILVRSTTLSEVGKELNLGTLLLMSKGERDSGGAFNNALLANTVEAVIGAIYLDSGLEPVKSFLERYLFPKIDKVLANKEIYDYKSKVQEVTQEKYRMSPVYKVISEDGPDHDKIFTVGLFLDKKVMGQGKGKSKQQAEQEAAKQAMEKIEGK